MKYTIDINGKRYELNESFKQTIEERARLEYKKNAEFSCWWKVENDNPVLVIETVGVMVPWDRMDQLEMSMPEEQHSPNRFGRTHFGLTPHHYEEVPSPGGNDPDKLPEKPDRVDGPMMVMWIPRHPDVDVTWGAGETISPMDTWVEWDVQEKANQPRPSKDKQNSHDAFESLCRIHDCEVLTEAKPTNNVPSGQSGSVERKGEEVYENGKFGGENWHV